MPFLVSRATALVDELAVRLHAAAWIRLDTALTVEFAVRPDRPRRASVEA